MADDESRSDDADSTASSNAGRGMGDFGLPPIPGGLGLPGGNRDAQSHGGDDDMSPPLGGSLFFSGALGVGSDVGSTSVHRACSSCGVRGMCAVHGT